MHQLHQFKFQIFQNKVKNSIKKSNDIYILLGSFYSINTAKFLKIELLKN